jgi:hypothetical protein
MVTASRVITTTIWGLVFGVICMLLSRYMCDVAFWPLGVSFLLHHAVMGFAIGVSAFRMNWAAHGAFWGALFGVFLTISVVGVVADPWIWFVGPVVWGFLIELLATKAFRQPQEF